MMRLAMLAAVLVSTLPPPADADPAKIWVAGDVGCVMVAGTQTWDGALAALWPGNTLFAADRMVSPEFDCRFDTPFTFVGDFWKLEDTEGHCTYPDGQVQPMAFEAHYASDVRLQVSVSLWTMPLDFQLCPLD